MFAILWCGKSLKIFCIQFYFWLVLFRSISAFSQATDTRSWDMQLRVSSGTLTIPHGRDWLGVSTFDFQISPPSCTMFGKKMSCQLLDATMRLGFNAEQRLSYLPYVEADFKVLDLHLNPWFSLLGPELRFERYALPISLDLHTNTMASAIGVKFAWHREAKYVRGGCDVAFSSVGARYVTYESGVIPFMGLYLIGISPSCGVRFGTSKISLNMRSYLSGDLSVGQSGGEPLESQGEFGSLLFQSQLGAVVRFNVRLFNFQQSSLNFFLQADGKFIILIDTGDRSNNMGGFLGIFAGLQLISGRQE